MLTRSAATKGYTKKKNMRTILIKPNCVGCIRAINYYYMKKKIRCNICIRRSVFRFPS